MKTLRRVVPILLCGWLGIESLSAEPILGYEIKLYTRRDGFRFYDVNVSADQLGTGRYYKLDTQAEGEQITGTLPAELLILGSTIGPPASERATATAAVSTDPLRIRLGVGTRTREEGAPVSAGANMQFGDLLRIQGPGSQVAATFEMRWSIDVGGYFRSSYLAEELGTAWDFDVPVRVAGYMFESAFFLESTDFDPLLYFFGAQFFENSLYGNVYDTGGEWVWIFNDSIVDDYSYGEHTPTVQFGPPPLVPGSPRGVTVRYRNTVTVPTDTDLNLVGRTSLEALCLAPSCSINADSLNSAFFGILLPEGYRLVSALGASYPPLVESDGGGGSGGADPGSEVPEPRTALLAAAGVVLLAGAKRLGS